MRLRFRVLQEGAVYISGLFGGSFAFIFHVLFLQSAVFSPKRMAVLFAILVLSAGIYHLIFTRIFDEQPPGNAAKFQTMLFWLLIPSLLAPSFFPVVDYPVSPLFQRESHIRIIIQVSGDAQGNGGELKNVLLNTGASKYNRHTFQLSGDWVKDTNSLLLAPGRSGELVWDGKVGEKSVLAVGAVNAGGTITVIWDGEEYSTELTEKPFYVVKRFTAPLWFTMSIVIAMIVCAGCVLFVLAGLYYRGVRPPENTLRFIFWGILISLSVFTVWAQLQAISAGTGFESTLESNQEILDGIALNPVQYRVFAPWFIEGLLFLAARLGYSVTYYQLFVFLRLTQNLSTFGLAYLYFRKLNFPRLLSFFGIILLAGSVLNTTYQSDFSFHTYFDLIFYLSAGILLLSGIYYWLPILVIFASLNRETSGVIPFLAISAALEEVTFIRKRSALIYSALTLLAWCAVFIALHIVYPSRALYVPYNHPMGGSLLLYNISLGSFKTLFSTLGFAPLLGLALFKKWPALLKQFFVILVPVWFGVHLVGGVVAETRLFLVPQTLIFIPTLLILVRELWKPISQFLLEEVR
jgi:hypothetical protein